MECLPGLSPKREEVNDAIEWARKTQGPVVLEFRVEQEEAVYPMVPQGAGAARDDPQTGEAGWINTTSFRFLLLPMKRKWKVESGK